MTYHHLNIKSSLAVSSIFFLLIVGVNTVFASTKITVSSGAWNSPSTWSPSGVPVASDDIIIASNHTITVNSDQPVHAITVSPGGILTWSTPNTLTIGGTFTVNGTVTMNGGNITLPATGTIFILGATSSFTWQPGNNTSGGATLFTNGIENFSPTSTLIIKKWYNYSTPIGSLVTNHFGNLVLNSVNSLNLVVEWNQNNYFQTHRVLGTLTIDQGWITLDKSGSITNTILGNIVLTSINSSFYAHNGTHPSSFTVSTTSVTNNGGTFYGLNDGNGNVTINVNGNFTNIGNVKIINNTGVGGVSNGNANFNVTGTFSQNTGDTRFVYNVTTLNSGIYTTTFGNLTLNGGILMGQTGIHTSGGTNTFTITNNINVNFSNTTDKFRGTSLSSIGSTKNNAKLNMVIGGTLTVSGVSASEFTSSASSGIETITINGNVIVNGTTASFNYGASSASHATIITVTGNVIVNGGTTFLSRNGGTADIKVIGNISILTGTLSVKGDTGSATLNVTGNYNQSGGNLYLHNNTATATSKSITMTVGGDFTHSGGIINFDNNLSSLSATHSINLAGANYSISGNGFMTHGGAGTVPVFGQLNFIRNGTTLFNRTSNGYFIQQVKQKVGAGCTLDVANGNIQTSSHPTASTDYFRVATGGTVNMRNGQFVSNAMSTNCGLQVDSGGTVKTYNTNGFYNGNTNACISASFNFNFYLHAYSVVEYNGVNNQTVSGLGVGIATTSNHKYGILRINFSGDDNVEYVSPSASNVYVRTQLDMTHGELNLNGYTLTVESGSPAAITRTGGYIKSEMNAADNASILVWKNMTPGLHKFPFGVNSTSFIPVSFTPTSGFGNDVSISTRATPATDNQPFPSGIIASQTNTINVNGNPVSMTEAIDRWWKINAPGFTASVILTYRGIENSSPTGNFNDPIRIIQWTGNGWTPPLGSGTGTTANTGTVTINFTNTFLDWLVIRHPNPLPIQLTAFTVVPGGTEVYISWITTAEINNDHFNVERSADGINFESIQRINGAGNSSGNLSYRFTDKTPIIGANYYRLKQTDYDGNSGYSEIKVVTFPDFTTGTISVHDFGPNPFDKKFGVNYQMFEKGTVTFQLTTQNGQLVHTEGVNAIEGTNRYEFNDESNLTPGIYLLTIIYKDKRITQKLIKK